MTRETALDGHLLPNETIVWSGRPQRGLRFEPLGPLFFGIAVLWCVGFLQAFGTTPGLFRWLVIVPTMVLATGRLFLDPWRRARTHYALTDRRVLIVRAPPWAEVIALPLERLPEAALDDEGDGRGTICFGRKIGVADLQGRMPRLVGIADAHRVYGLIERGAAHPR